MTEEVQPTSKPESNSELLEDAERALNYAFSSGKADRAAITQAAQLDAAEAVAMAGIAMESDEAADEAMRISAIASKSGNREQAKAARKKERTARKKANADHRAATASAKRAYDAIKFSAPNKMGFLRAVQFLFAGHIATVIVFLLLTSRDTMVYTTTSVVDWVMVILESVAFWMFINRYRVGRPFVIAMAVVGIVLPAAIDVTLGTFNPIALAMNSVFYAFLIIYFATSKRVKATLVNDLRKRTGDYENEDLAIERRGWPFFRNLIIYFIVFSNVGHWMEMAMCQLIILGVVQGDYDPSNTMLWRDWLFPFAMEGVAVVFIALVLYPLFEWFKKRIRNRFLPYVISFFANALFCTVVEFIGGLLCNPNHECWDYSNLPFNFMGQVCLQNALAFGVAASLIAWFVYPLLERWIARASRDVMNIVFVVVLAFGLIVWSLYIIPGSPSFMAYTQPSANQIEGSERSHLSTISALAAKETQSLEKAVAESRTLTDEERTAIQSHIDAINAEYEALQALLEEPAIND